MINDDIKQLVDDEDEPSVPAEDPPERQSFTWPQMFGINYSQIADILLKGGGVTGAGSYNKIDAQQLRLKAADIAAGLTYTQFQKGTA